MKPGVRSASVISVQENNWSHKRVNLEGYSGSTNKKIIKINTKHPLENDWTRMNEQFQAVSFLKAERGLDDKLYERGLIKWIVLLFRTYHSNSLTSVGMWLENKYKQ